MNSAKPTLIALDWGTTSLRAYLLDRQGGILESKSAPLGILKIADGNFNNAFEQVCGSWLDQYGILNTLASGMVGARQGWVEARYVPCPAGFDELSRQLTTFRTARGVSFSIVPGLVFEDSDGAPDVMRGEETQIFGALTEPSHGNQLFVLPGTHSKWAKVRDGRVAEFATFMTGEVFALLSDHSILGRPMTSREFDRDAFARGCRHSLRPSRGAALLHDLFSARTLNLMGKLEATAIHSYLSGLMIGAEIGEARRRLEQETGIEITIVGDESLATLYRQALTIHGYQCTIADADVTPRGLWCIAKRAELMQHA